MGMLTSDYDLLLNEIELTKQALIATNTILEKYQGEYIKKIELLTEKIDSIEASVSSINSSAQQIYGLSEVVSRRLELTEAKLETTLQDSSRKIIDEIKEENTSTFSTISDGIDTLISLIDSSTVRRITGWVGRLFK